LAEGEPPPGALRGLPWQVCRAGESRISRLVISCVGRAALGRRQGRGCGASILGYPRKWLEHGLGTRRGAEAQRALVGPELGDQGECGRLGGVNSSDERVRPAEASDADADVQGELQQDLAVEPGGVRGVWRCELATAYGALAVERAPGSRRCGGTFDGRCLPRLHLGQLVIWIERVRKWTGDPRRRSHVRVRVGWWRVSVRAGWAIGRRPGQTRPAAQAEHSARSGQVLGRGATRLARAGVARRGAMTHERQVVVGYAIRSAPNPLSGALVKAPCHEDEAVGPGRGGGRSGVWHDRGRAVGARRRQRAHWAVVVPPQRLLGGYSPARSGGPPWLATHAQPRRLGRGALAPLRPLWPPSDSPRVASSAWGRHQSFGLTPGWHSASKEVPLEVRVHEQRWLPFQPEEYAQAIWDQAPEDERKEAIRLYARLMARAASDCSGTATTAATTRREEASGDNGDS